MRLTLPCCLLALLLALPLVTAQRAWAQPVVTPNYQTQQGAPTRDLPTDAYLVTLTFQRGMAYVNGNSVRLAPGLRVRDGFNRFVLSQNYPTTSMYALVKPDLMGNLLDVWLLRGDELRNVQRRMGQAGVPGTAR